MNNASQAHPIDNSALVHLAVHSKNHSNVFRLEAQLRSPVRPGQLQQAVNAVAARFPMLAAGIRKQGNTFMVIPAPEKLAIRADVQPLAYMPAEEIRRCGARVLYGQRRIAVEFFHSLTDGAGGLQFLKALLAEYLGIQPEPLDAKAAWEDSYLRYADGKPAPLPGGSSWLLPAAPEDGAIARTTLIFSLEKLREKLRAEHMTPTVFFTALLAQTAMELQRREVTPDRPLQPVQIMVPVDLRRRFSSASMRNFSLYALPRLTPDAACGSFPEIAENLAAQLRAQTAYPNLRGMIASNVHLAQKAAALPLWMKCAAVRAGFEICGGHSSCITVSNLGQADFPERIAQEITRLDFMLTPRTHSPYNCGIVSAGDTVSLTMTRRGADRGFEKLFAANLLRQGAVPTAAEDPD